MGSVVAPVAQAREAREARSASRRASACCASAARRSEGPARRRSPSRARRASRRWACGRAYVGHGYRASVRPRALRLARGRRARGRRRGARGAPRASARDASSWRPPGRRRWTSPRRAPTCSSSTARSSSRRSGRTSRSSLVDREAPLGSGVCPPRGDLRARGLRFALTPTSQSPSATGSPRSTAGPTGARSRRRSTFGPSSSRARPSRSMGSGAAGGPRDRDRSPRPPAPRARPAGDQTGPNRPPERPPAAVPPGGRFAGLLADSGQVRRYAPGSARRCGARLPHRPTLGARSALRPLFPVGRTRYPRNRDRFECSGLSVGGRSPRSCTARVILAIVTNRWIPKLGSRA